MAVPSSVGLESTTDVSPFLQIEQIIYYKFLYIGNDEVKEITSFLTSFSTFLLSVGFSDNPFKVLVISSPTVLNSFKPKPLVVAACVPNLIPDVIIGFSVSKGIPFLLHVIFDGEIILPAPSWVSYAPQAILGRNKTQILQTKRENNWFPTASEIEEIILKDKNKNYLLFLNSPNNPSGQICENLEEIADIAKKI